MTQSPDLLSLPERVDRRIAVDVGGSTLRMVECDLDGTELVHERFVHPQNTFASLQAGLEWFVAKLGHRPSIAVVGAAGPIEHARYVRLTNNADWPVFDATSAEQALGCKIYLLNDLVIAAASIPALSAMDLDVVQKGAAENDGPRLVVTLSTGVNDALALPPRFGPLGILAAESGHTPFAPRDEVETEFLRWTWKQGMTYVGFEHVISGSHGFRRVFDFVTQVEGVKPLQQTVDALAGDAPEGPIISAAALDQNDPAALRVLQIVGGVVGTYLGSRVVATLASGGVYLVGSISQHRGLMDYFVERTQFLDRFTNAGPYSRLVENVPISRILHPEFGLLGACEIARRLP